MKLLSRLQVVITIILCVLDAMNKDMTCVIWGVLATLSYLNYIADYIVEKITTHRKTDK